MDRITFKVNGVKHSVGSEVSSNVKLVDFLRDEVECRGTKYMCREAGCGACIVSVRRCAGGPVQAVNACMVSITSCQDWEITTIEGLGNRNKGYHVLQQTLAEYNGTQCGYCSPAMIMKMYSVLQNGNKPTMLEIEKSFGSNVCRCTGYRPILDAFKTFAKDAQTKKLTDIEDLAICKKTGTPCNTSCKEDDWCFVEFEDNRTIEIRLKDYKFWYRVSSIRSIFDVLNEKGYNSYMLVFGNTGRGVYPFDEYPNTLIDISTVPELKVVKLDQNLIVGAGLTITEIMETFKAMSKTDYFGYLDVLYKHIDLVAHIPVRNLGSIAGNLILKNQHKSFGSDLFLLFETVGACLTIVDSKNVYGTLTMQQFLKEDMKGKVIVSILLPPLNDEYKIYSYRVMPRSQNAHAIVNGGFLFKLTDNNTVVEARIVYGGLSPAFVRAEATEKFLIGKQLFTNDTLQAGLKILKDEVVVTPNPPEPSVEYRRHLVLVLFYKALLYLCPKQIVSRRYISERIRIHDLRPVSKGRQVYDTNPSKWPLNQPIPKIDGLIQCAGEAQYTEDLPVQPREVHAAFVLSTVAVGDIVNIDASRALKTPGVIAFYSAKDIPGINSFILLDNFLFQDLEEIFCSGAVKYFNQPIGLIVAETQHIANVAAKLVTATYKNVKDPVLKMEDALKDPARLSVIFTNNATDRGNDVVKVIKGEASVYGQYHFMLENLSCITRPTEEGLEVFTTSHWIDSVQVTISRALNIQENRIDVHIRRLGGSYGIKISRASQVAVACSLVVQKLNRPCRFVVPLTTTTRAIGKRFPCYSTFECGLNSSGVIQYMNQTIYEDNGYKVNEYLAILAASLFNNGYNVSKWSCKIYDLLTDSAKNTWCRAPGSLESVATAEQIMERISYELGLDPVDVRMANIDTTKYNDLIEMTNTLKSTADYTRRKAAVIRFNAENRWRKRGLRFSTFRWTSFSSLAFDINLSVFHGDGTVIINHGAVEMGQGVNTKVIQICAHILNIPITKIQVKSNTTITNPNCFVTGGSLGSQYAGLGVKKCSEELNVRLEPIRAHNPSATWEELIAKAYAASVDLQVHSHTGAADETIYDLFGVCFAETEVDVLTGEFEIKRVDILEDVGQSVSPEIDVGQVEGAFMMGQGYWTSENLVFSHTGELLSDRTWNYFVPLATDIPQDFRINFRKKSYSFPQIQGAKATGEPPICLSIAVAFALREAIAEARQDSGILATEWFNIDGPFTVEKIALSAASKIEDFKLC